MERRRIWLCLQRAQGVWEMKNREAIERAAIIGFAAVWAADLDGEIRPCPDEEYHMGQQLYAEAKWRKAAGK